MTPRVTDVTFSIAPASDRARGCLGWARFTLDDTYRVDGATIRRTQTGRFALSFPARGRGNQQRQILWVLDARVRAAIETQVISALARDGRLAS
jgi:hypothetical protein